MAQRARKVATAETSGPKLALSYVELLTKAFESHTTLLVEQDSEASRLEEIASQPRIQQSSLIGYAPS
jgi:hypothetical protein